MRGLRLAALMALIAGLALLAYAATQGSLRVGFFLIIPFVYGTGGAAALGMLLLMASGVLWFMSAFQGMTPVRDEGFAPERPPDRGSAFDPTTHRHVERKSGGVVLLGPIPIVWGNARVLPWMIGAGAALLVLALLLSWGFR